MKSSDWIDSMRASKKINKKICVAVFSHAHHATSKGGAETAALVLVNALRASADIGDVIAVAAQPSAGASGFSRFAQNDLLWSTPPVKGFDFSSQNLYLLKKNLEEFIEYYQPDVIHLQHFVNFGVEIFSIIKAIDKNIKIIFTAHEMQAICNHNGQMVKVNNLDLCTKSSPAMCSGCFPNYSTVDFWLRSNYIINNMAAIDEIISPSQFLADRLIEFGLPKNKITVIENLQCERSLSSLVQYTPGTPLRLGFFGQVNPYKGLDILLEAMTLMQKSAGLDVHLEIHGANLDIQPVDFQLKTNSLLEPLLASGSVTWPGPYRYEELEARMSGVDCVIVPSIWWENSPMVIQEALALGRYVVCSNIGGMKEKVIDGVNGAHFTVGSSRSLAQTLANIFNNGFTDPLGANPSKPSKVESWLDLYRK